MSFEFAISNLSDELTNITLGEFINPYSAYDGIRKILTKYGLSLDGEELNFNEMTGEYIFHLDHDGIDNIDQIPTATDENMVERSPHYIYIAYDKTDDGKYEFYADILTQDELDSLDEDDNDDDDNGDDEDM